LQTGENSIIWSFIICILHKIATGWLRYGHVEGRGLRCAYKLLVGETWRECNTWKTGLEDRILKEILKFWNCGFMRNQWQTVENMIQNHKFQWKMPFFDYSFYIKTWQDIATPIYRCCTYRINVYLDPHSMQVN